MSIRGKLMLALLAFASIPPIAVIAVGFFQAKGALETARIEQLESIADLKAAKIQDFFEELARDITGFKNYPAVKKNLPILSRLVDSRSKPEYQPARRELDAALVLVQDVYQYIDVLLADARGIGVYASAPEHAEEHLGVPLRGPDGLLFTEGSKGIHYSEIFVSTSEPGRYVMMVSAPVYGREGALLGVMAIEIDMQPMFEFIQDTTGLGRTGETLIARQEGQTALFLNPLRHAPGAALKKTIPLGGKIAIPIQKALQGESGSGISIDYRNRKVVAAWRCLPIMNWGMVAKIDVKEAFGAVVYLRSIMILVVLAVISAAMVVASAVARSIAEPILALERGTEVIGRGDLDFRVGTDAGDEVGRLSRAFDRMTDDLKSVTTSRDELEAEIAEREKAERELSRQRKLSEEIVSSSMDGIIALDLERRITVWNAGMEAITGLGADEVVGKNVYEALAFLKTTGEDVFIERAIAGETVVSKDLLYYVDESGRSGYAESHYSPLRSEEGEIIGALGVVRDTTERKRADEELRAREERYRGVVEGQTEFITRWKPDGTRTFVNEAYCRYFGKPREALLGTSFWSAIPEEERPGIRRKIEALSVDNPIVGDEHRAIKPDGSLAWHQWTDRGIFDEAGNLLEVQSVGRDITEQRAAAQALAESERRLSTLMGNLPGMAYRRLNDTDGTMEFASEGCLALTGFESAEIVGNRVTSFRELIHADDRERVWREVQEALDGERPYRLQYRIVTAGGDEKTVWERGIGVFGRDTQPAALEGFISDITERVRAETAISDLAAKVSPGTGEEFFSRLVEYLATTLRVDCAFVGEYFADGGEKVDTVAVYSGGKLGENFEYPLLGTPCEHVVGKKLCAWSEGVQGIFPGDTLLAELGAQCYVGMPLFDSHGEPSGIVVVIDDKPCPELEFTKKLLRICAARAASELERMRSDEALMTYRHHLEDIVKERTAELTAAHASLKDSLQRLQDDEEAGRVIQFKLLPEERRRIDGYEFHHRLLPSMYLSGDFVDCFQIDERHAGFYIADVSGHGASSAFLTVLLKSFMSNAQRSYSAESDMTILEPDKLLARLNEELLRDNLEKHITIFYGCIDTVENVLVFANAGMFPAPMLWEDSGFDFVTTKGAPVGLFAFSRYEAARRKLPEKFVFGLFSDGILEVLPQDSLAGKLEFLQRFGSSDGFDIDALVRTLELEKRESLPDDIALLIIKRSPSHG